MCFVHGAYWNQCYIARIVHTKLIMKSYVNSQQLYFNIKIKLHTYSSDMQHIVRLSHKAF